MASGFIPERKKYLARGPDAANPIGMTARIYSTPLSDLRPHVQSRPGVDVEKHRSTPSPGSGIAFHEVA